MKRVILTADDFGAALEINEAVERAHRSTADRVRENALSLLRRRASIGTGGKMSDPFPRISNAGVPDSVREKRGGDRHYAVIWSSLRRKDIYLIPREERRLLFY